MPHLLKAQLCQIRMRIQRRRSVTYSHPKASNQSD
uniref:Uncharacterized protein n=1 Tax=Anguilla anguilla TaxID=7936 RepID=A0A0E9SFU6_ANGAN